MVEEYIVEILENEEFAKELLVDIDKIMGNLDE